MQQFDLSLWLQDKSRKVVTRDGRSVRIVCIDSPDEVFPIVGFVENEITTRMWQATGEYNNIPDCVYDLFFADEEKELTEFDYAVLSIISDHNSHTDSIEAFAKRNSKNLLNIARKELQPEFDKELDEAYKTRDEVVYLEGYDKGHEDALKDLPKWKKATEHKEFALHVCVMDNHMCTFLDTEVNEGEYYIELDDLRTLPKEE